MSMARGEESHWSESEDDGRIGRSGDALGQFWRRGERDSEELGAGGKEKGLPAL